MVRRILAGFAVLVVILAGIGFFYLRSELPGYRDAFLYAYGPYEFVRSVQDLSGQRQGAGGRFGEDGMPGALVNRHIHNEDLADHTQRTVTTPNNDTLYTSAVLELSATPVELVLPEVGERYLSAALLDVFTDQFAHIGPGETGGQGGTYWIVGPDETATAPEGVTVIRASGNDVWLLVRIFVSGPGDLAAARTAQQGVLVRPVFRERPARPFETIVTDINDSQNFVAVVNEALARNPGHPQSQRATEFSATGIGPEAEPSPVARWFWSQVTGRAEAAISRQVNQQMSAQTGWSDPPRNIGFYGDDDALRSGVALIGFGALRREDAIYYRMTRTEDGKLLDGRQGYRMTLPPEVPAEAFWSIALYEPDETGRFFFYENPTGRHSLNSGSPGLASGEDGRVVLQIGPTPPAGDTANWLPTPDGPFAAFFRVYLPTEQANREGWMPPAITPE